MGTPKKEDTYVVHGAQIRCPYAQRDSNVVVPMGHGVFIHDIEQLTIADWRPEVNVLTFGACTSPENPAVQVAAARIMEMVQKETKEKKKGFFEKVAEIFCKPKEDAVPDASLVWQCVAPCVPAILAAWDNGKDTVSTDGSPPLLGGGALNCAWSDQDITIITTGQPE